MLWFSVGAPLCLGPSRCLHLRLPPEPHNLPLGKDSNWSVLLPFPNLCDCQQGQTWLLFLAPLTRTSHFLFLSLSFPICEMGTVVPSVHVAEGIEGTVQHCVHQLQE